MNVLNLYAGLRGNRKLWQDVSVTSVEINTKIIGVYKTLFPLDEIICNDAHEYLLRHAKEFEFIWSSPPCQSHSRMMKATRHDVTKYPDMSLYQEIIWLQHFYTGLWVVENVKPYYEPLINPSVVIGRHYLWSNFKITPFLPPAFPDLINTTTVKGAEELKKFYGLEYNGNLYLDGHHPTQALRNCVHPEIGLHVLNCAIGKEKISEQTLF